MNSISFFISSLIILNEVSLFYALFLKNNQKSELEKIGKNIWENFAENKLNDKKGNFLF